MDYLKFHEHTLELPSEGLAYSDDLRAKLISGHSMKISTFLMGHRRKVRGLVEQKSDLYSFYRLLLDQLVVEPKDFDFDKLLVSDVLALMYAIHIPSFGNDYPLSYVCPFCRSGQIYNMLLTEIPVMYAHEHTNEEKGTKFQAEGIEIELDKNDIVCHLPRLEDEKLVTQIMHDYRRLGKLESEDFDQSIIRRLVLIDSIDGKSLPNTSKFDAMMKWTEQEHDLIDETIDKHETGIVFDGTVSSKCKNCKKTVELSPPAAGPEFFRPKRKSADPSS